MHRPTILFNLQFRSVLCLDKRGYKYFLGFIYDLKEYITAQHYLEGPWVLVGT